MLGYAAYQIITQSGQPNMDARFRRGLGAFSRGPMKRKLESPMERAAAAKARFSQIYEHNDPRYYYRHMGTLDYILPQVANPIFQQLIEARYLLKKSTVNVLDLGASYGINGALLKYPVTWDMLRNRYQMADIERLTSRQLEKFDRNYFRSWPRHKHIHVVGLDAALPAVRYAEWTGAVDRGFAIDLETSEPDPALAATLKNIDLIISTGSVGYITDATFERIARYTSDKNPPWVASFVLRMWPYDKISACLEKQGLITERFDGATFVQRRFADTQEMNAVLNQMRRANVPTQGREDRGYLHAELFVSRPAAEVAKAPINRLISVSSGANRIFAGLAPQVMVPAHNPEGFSVPLAC